MRTPSKKELVDLVLQLDSTLADLEAAKRKGYLTRDLPKLRETAARIYDYRTHRKSWRKKK